MPVTIWPGTVIVSSIRHDIHSARLCDVIPCPIALYGVRRHTSPSNLPITRDDAIHSTRRVLSANHRPSTCSSPRDRLNGLHGEAPAFLSPIRGHSQGHIPADPAPEQEFCIHDARGIAGPPAVFSRASPRRYERTPVLYFFFLHLLCKIVCLLFRP